MMSSRWALWLVTWLSRGVMASSLRSRMRSRGGTSVFLKSNSSYSLVMICCRQREREMRSEVGGDARVKSKLGSKMFIFVHEVNCESLTQWLLYVTVCESLSVHFILFISSVHGGQTNFLVRHMMHTNWKRHHGERSSCETVDTVFWTSQPAKWLVSLSEFDPFDPVTFGKSRRAAVHLYVKVPHCRFNIKI